ncbi:condensation domain-containing protein [Nonomuraea sp. NPDC049158]|uniref:condensation domain-containing protein n=1 Tax=Nonomuraea sp. NPDC049158 TaxID=3155649 RepID=UPI0033ED995A
MPDEHEPMPSPAQQRLWFLQQLAPDSPQYNVFRGYELRGPLDVAALRRALGALADRHVALRMRFPADGGVARAVVSGTPFDVELPSTDLGSEPTATDLGSAAATDLAGEPGWEAAADLSGERGWEAAATEFARVWSARPFDLARDDLIRAHLLCVTPDLHVLLLCVHHIVIDGWSVPIIDEELGLLYAGRPLGPPPAGYLEYARWQQELAGSPAAERVLAYWRRRLAGAPELITLPADRPRPRIQDFRGGLLVKPVPVDVTATLRSFAAAHRVTPYTVAYAAFAVLLARYARASDLVIGVVVAGRSRPEFAGTVGFFVGTLPVRMDLSGDPSFLAVLGAAREALFDAYDNDLLPFDVLVDQLSLRRDPSYIPLLQVIFQMLVTPAYGTETRWGDLAARLWGRDVSQPATRFDLEVHLLDQAEDDMVMEVSFNADLFDEETVAGLADDYVRVLRLLCGDPDQPVSGAYALLGGGARQAQVSIRDEHGVSLPYGVPGEVWLDGTSTGLLGRMGAGGGLDVLGSTDGELVVRGCRVPGEVIERTLLDEPSVAAAEVSVGDDGELTARLTAVPGGTRPGRPELRARLRRRLPGFLVPGTFLWNDEPSPAEAPTPTAQDLTAPTLITPDLDATAANASDLDALGLTATGPSVSGPAAPVPDEPMVFPAAPVPGEPLVFFVAAEPPGEAS